MTAEPGEVIDDQSFGVKIKSLQASRQTHGELPRGDKRRLAVWVVAFMHYDLGYFDDETCRLEPIDNPFGPKVLPMCPE